MRYGLAYNGFFGLDELLSIAREADGTIVEGVWLCEHLGYRDAFVPAAAILSMTAHLSVNMTAVSPYGRNPMHTAMQTASLSEIGPGRVSLVLGTGNKLAFRESGMDQERPLSAIREYIQVLRALWSADAVTLEGQIYNMKGATFHVPMSSPPPLHVAATGKKMLALAGQVADGVVISAGMPTAALRPTLDAVAGAASAAGRSAGAAIGLVVTSLDESREVAIEKSRQMLAYLLRNPVVAEKVNASGLSLDSAALMDAATNRDWPKAWSLISDEIVEACSIAGTPKELPDYLDRYVDSGLDKVVLLPLDGARGGRLAVDALCAL